MAKKRGTDGRDITIPKPPTDDDLPYGDETPKNWEFMKQFAVAYADFESETRGQKRESMLSVFPEMEPDTAKRLAYRWLERDDVQAYMRKVPTQRITSGKVSALEFGAKVLDIAEFLIDRGKAGDASAAASFTKLGAIALGFHTTKTEDMTPPERKLPAMPPSQMLEALQEQLDRVNRLRQPVPMAKLASAEAVEVQETKVKIAWPPFPTDPEGRIMDPCVVCGTRENVILCGDDRMRCEAHLREWLQESQQQSQPGTNDEPRAEPEPGNPAP